MRTFRVTFPGETPALDLQADRMHSGGNGARLYRKDGEAEQEVAHFRDGSYVACFELPDEP